MAKNGIFEVVKSLNVFITIPNSIFLLQNDGICKKNEILKVKNRILSKFEAILSQKKSKKVAFFVSYKLNLVILGGSIPHVFHMFYGRLLAQVIALMRVYWCIENFHHKLKRLGELAGRNNVGIVKMPILDHFGRFFAIWVPYGFQNRLFIMFYSVLGIVTN